MEAAVTPALNSIALVAISVLAIWLDLTSRRIPNYITLPFMITGLVYHTWPGCGEGLFFSLAGLLLGLSLLLLPFAMGGVGGGDVKYLASTGALQGASFVFATFLVGAVLGGLFSLAYLTIKGRLSLTLRRLGGVAFTPLFRVLGLSLKSELFFRAAQWFSPPSIKKEEKLYLPYGVPIAIGALLTLSGLAQRYLPGLFFWQ
jgi:prepilin peptidase CpaA